jgi:hypothetical protein
MVMSGARIIGSPLAKVLKGALKAVPAGSVLTGVLAYDFITDLFKPGNEFGNTDQTTADGLTKSAMAIVQDSEQGGIALNGLKGRDGDPLPTNYVVIDLEKERVFPIFKYRSGKSIRAARRRGSFRGFGRAQRSFTQRKYLYN